MNPSQKRKPLRLLLAVAGTLLTLAVGVVSFVWAASADRANVERTLKANEKRIEDHEQRLRAVERDVPEIATNVQWIRSEMERQKHK
jgi:flagellar basal body-associated protein FliL